MDDVVVQFVPGFDCSGEIIKSFYIGRYLLLGFQRVYHYFSCKCLYGFCTTNSLVDILGRLSRVVRGLLRNDLGGIAVSNK